MNFMKKLVVFAALALVSVNGIGCSDASMKSAEEKAKAAEEAAKKGVKAAEEMASKGADMAKQGFERMKAEFAKLNHEHLEGIEKKIKDLSGEAMTEAQKSFAVLKEKLAAIKDAAPEKFDELKAEIEEKLTELKKMIGM